MKEIFAEHGTGATRRRPRSGLTGGQPVPGPLAGLRVIDVGTRISAPFCAGPARRVGAEVIKVEQPGTGDFMRTIGPFAARRLLLLCLGGGGARPPERHLRPAHSPRARTCSAGWRPRPTWCARTSGPAPWRVGPRPGRPRPPLVVVRISVFGQDGPYSPAARARPPGHRLRRPAPPDR